MKELTKKDKDVAKEIQENMFDFENEPALMTRACSIRSLDNELIVVALKADDHCQKSFLVCLKECSKYKR